MDVPACIPKQRIQDGKTRLTIAGIAMNPGTEDKGKIYGNKIVIVMTDEQIKKNADAYASKLIERDYHEDIWLDLYNAHIAGAHSRDEEIKSLEKNYREEFDILEEELESLRKGFYERGDKLKELMLENNKLRNPWISVEERLPEEPLTICAVWLKGDDLVPHISLYDSGCFSLLPVDVTVTHWMAIPELKK